MKTVAAIFMLCASILFAGTNIVNTSNQLEVGAYVSLPSNEQYAKGFLEYKGKHNEIVFCALSIDSGSAIPSGDFRLYAKVKGLYRKVLSLPMLTRKGYRCACEADTLKVYLTRTYKKDKKPNDKDLLLTINLTKLVEAHTEQKKQKQNVISSVYKARLFTARNPQEIEAALATGADINTKHKGLFNNALLDGAPALHFAVFHSNLKNVSYLICKGADVNVKTDLAGDTPLHFAARFGYMQIVKLLLKNGADPHIIAMRLPGPHESDQQCRHITPSELAQEKGHTEIVKILEVAMKNSDNSESSGD